MRFNPFTEIRIALRDLGLIGTLRAAPRWLFDVAERYKRNRIQRKFLDQEGFDQVHGTDTAEMMMPSELGHVASRSGGAVHDYQTLDVPELRAPLDKFQQCGFEQFTYIDIGCGKGKPLLVASEFPFRRIIGLDISETCVSIANRNIDIYTGGSSTQKDRFSVQQLDAELFEFPEGDLFVFLFNPFGVDTLREVTHNLAADLRARPRRVLIAYWNLQRLPGGFEVIMESGAFEPVATQSRYAVFASKPSEWVGVKGSRP